MQRSAILTVTTGKLKVAAQPIARVLLLTVLSNAHAARSAALRSIDSGKILYVIVRLCDIIVRILFYTLVS